MKIKTILIVTFVGILVAGCKKVPVPKSDNMAISHSKNAKGDSTIYGLACPGCTDSVIVLLPNAGGDPITFNILEARRNSKVFGTPQIGDWLGIVPTPEDKRVARLVVDLDEIKGTWTYQVMPHLRDVSLLDKKQQARILANMPDSIVKTYMIPREYGFTLKRQSQASPVGFVRSSNNLEDDSPVEYPKVPTYIEWHAYNGNILLTKGTFDPEKGFIKDPKVKPDTFHLVYMKDDSLTLKVRNRIIGFHRQISSRAANAKANAAAAMQEAKNKDLLKK